MLRSIIEFFRREAGLSILDLTTDICSSSMYYFYIRGEKNLTDKKVQALKEALGYDQMTEEEINQFNNEITTVIDCFLDYRYTLERFDEEVKYLLDYRKQAMLEEKLVINYLILMTYHTYYHHDYARAQKYFQLFASLSPYTNTTQQIHIYALGTMLKAYERPEMLKNLKELDYLLRHEKDQHLNGHFYRIMGNAYYLIRKERLTYHCYELALDFFQKHNNFVGIVRVLNAIARLKLNNIEDDSIIDELIDNFQKANQLQNGFAIIEALTNIIIGYSQLGEVDLIKTYFQNLIACIIQYSVHVIDEQLLIDLGLTLLVNNLIESLETLEKITQGMQIVDNDTMMAKVFYVAKVTDSKEKIKFYEKRIKEDDFRFCNFGVCKTIFKHVDQYYEQNHQYKKQALIKDKFISILKEYYS